MCAFDLKLSSTDFNFCISADGCQHLSLAKACLIQTCLGVNRAGTQLRSCSKLRTIKWKKEALCWGTLGILSPRVAAQKEQSVVPSPIILKDAMTALRTDRGESLCFFTDQIWNLENLRKRLNQQRWSNTIMRAEMFFILLTGQVKPKSNKCGSMLEQTEMFAN